MAVTLVEAAPGKDIIGDPTAAADSPALLSVIMSVPLSLRFKKDNT